jgi:hypothetical protein
VTHVASTKADVHVAADARQAFTVLPSRKKPAAVTKLHFVLVVAIKPQVVGVLTAQLC